MDDLAFKPAAEQAALVRSGAATPVELVEAALRRIDALDPRLNAFVDVDADRALAAAAAVRHSAAQPFAGVPVAVKANTAVEGMRIDFGSAFLADHRPSHSAYLVRRLQEAGFVVVGITRMPEFALLPTTEPRHGGPVHNPWDLGRSPGGSSGGAGAAVAAGIVPIGQGNDAGGSLRIPAACCGLVGLKPSRGRVSQGPELDSGFLNAEGVLTRTVADTALALDVLGGYEVGDAYWAPRPSEPYVHAMRRNPGRLRVGMTTANPLGIDVDPECARGMHEAGDLLAGLGHEVVEANPVLPGRELMVLFAQVFGATQSLAAAYGVSLAGREPTDEEIEPLSRAMWEQAERRSAVAYLGGMAQLQALARGVVALFAGFDLLLTPAVAERPPAIGECTGFGEDPIADFARSGRFTPFTAIFNVTGQPAITLPVGIGADGLPTAVQIVAKPLGEDTLLQVAAQLEAAHPWAQHRPPVHAE